MARPTLANSDSVGASRDGNTSKGDMHSVDTLHGGLVATAIGAVTPGLQLRLHCAFLSCRVLDDDFHLSCASSCPKAQTQLWDSSTATPTPPPRGWLGLSCLPLPAVKISK